AAADLSRVQLHDPASLRFRGALQAPRLHSADGRVRPVGQHRQRHRPRPPAAQRSAVSLATPPFTPFFRAQVGQNETGAVWLNADAMNPYDYWQFWRNCEDGDVGRLLKLFTELPLEEIARVTRLKGQELNEAKKILATEATTLLHGRGAAEQAAETAR